MVNKLTNNVKPLDEVDKINEIIDELDNANVAIDSKSITKNTSDELQAVGVIDSNNTANAIKTWTGTKTQYNALPEVQSWYAWNNNGTTYFTASSSPSVGDTVYNSDKTDSGYVITSVSGSTIEIEGV